MVPGKPELEDILRALDDWGEHFHTKMAIALFECRHEDALNDGQAEAFCRGAAQRIEKEMEFLDKNKDRKRPFKKRRPRKKKNADPGKE